MEIIGHKFIVDFGMANTQVQDYEKRLIYSNWTLLNGQFEDVKETIKPTEK